MANSYEIEQTLRRLTTEPQWKDARKPPKRIRDYRIGYRDALCYALGANPIYWRFSWEVKQ